MLSIAFFIDVVSVVMLSVIMLSVEAQQKIFSRHKLEAHYGKVAYFELSSHQISEPKQQAKRENLHLANISETR